MYKKNRDSWNSSNTAGIVAISIYIILTVVGSNSVLFALRVLCAGIAAIAYAFRMKAEISNNESHGNSAFLIVICLLNIVISAIQL